MRAGARTGKHKGVPVEIQPINFADKFTLFDEHWSPRIIAQLNDYHFKLVKIQGEFIWHNHPETDEVFIVIKGEMRIEFPGFHTELSEGELCVIPRGIEHKPVAQDECQIMLIEPAGTVNTGDVIGERTNTEEKWI